MLNKESFKNQLKGIIKTKEMLSLKCDNWYNMDIYVINEWENMLWWHIYKYNIMWKNLDTGWQFVCNNENDVEGLYNLIYEIYKINNK